MRFRTVLAASGVLVTACLANGASAAPVTVKDVVGDGNAINGQGVVGGAVENRATPGSQAGYDIASVRFTSTFTGHGRKRAPKDLVVVLELAGKPVDRAVAYFVEVGAVGECEAGLNFAYVVTPTGTTSSEIRACATNGIDPHAAIPLAMPKIGAKTITWTIPYRTLTSIRQAKVRVGDDLPEIGAMVRLTNGVTNVPVMDTLASDTAYRLGS